MAGSVVVSLAGRQDPYALRAGAGDLAAAVRYASSAARAEHRRHRLWLSPDLRTFRVEAESVDAGDAEFVPAAGMAGQTRTLPQGVTVKKVARSDGAEADEHTAVEFGPDGSGFDGRIEVEGRNKLKARVTVLGETGQVVVEK